jgi:hypothetical protein
MNVVHREGRERNTVVDQSLLERSGGWMSVGFEQELGPVGGPPGTPP